MKSKIFFLLVFLFILPNFTFSACNPCCCQTSPNSGQYKCYSGGTCCAQGTPNEYWTDGSCYDFDVELVGPNIFTVGVPTKITLKIYNKGAYTDTYNISCLSINPSVTVDLAQPQIKEVPPGGIGVAEPEVRVLVSTTTGIINCTAVSNGDLSITKSATLSVYESESLLSIQEFNSYGIVIIVVIVLGILLICSKNRLKKTLLFSILLILLLPSLSVAGQPKIWVEGSRLLTIGEPQTFNVYVQNLGATEDSYNLSFTIDSPTPHLVDVSFPSNKIAGLGNNEVGVTQAVITLRGPITSGGVTFTATSESDSTTDYSRITLAGGFPVSLPEFNTVVLLVILFTVPVGFTILTEADQFLERIFQL